MNPHAPATEIDSAAVQEFAADVAYYLSLTPRQLPSRYLYDDLGSALFETICRLPWYPITRAETRLLAAHGHEICACLPSLANIVELGPGNGDKLRVLLDAFAPPHAALNVHLVDVSGSALASAANIVGELDGVHVVTHRASYNDGLRAATARTKGRTLVIFLGSNIGNFDPPGAAAFLHAVRARLKKDDALLLGVDLVKPRRQLLLAYDDPLGVTAAFNRNLLVRINRELGASIDLEAFAHRAVWNDAESRVEMHLVARSPQSMCIPRAHVDIRLAAGDVIWSESSYKYVPDGIAHLLRSAAFTPTAQWIDQHDRFALTLAEAV
jgi:dimethylhistidine N-methyltransferase